MICFIVKRDIRTPAGDRTASGRRKGATLRHDTRPLFYQKRQHHPKRDYDECYHAEEHGCSGQHDNISKESVHLPGPRAIGRTYRLTCNEKCGLDCDAFHPRPATAGFSHTASKAFEPSLCAVVSG
jgi:hypothetical protein